eukprot:9122616-Karenia_brevis.AAC.1
MQNDLVKVQGGVKTINSSVSSLQPGQKDGFGKMEGMLTRIMSQRYVPDAPAEHLHGGAPAAAADVPHGQ